ncbi:MAG: hypothetical protein L0Z53_22780 [Acidobacteriales bacterium]|nr:hypothetical protein [Terriglobales bacterium]
MSLTWTPIMTTNENRKPAPQQQEAIERFSGDLLGELLEAVLRAELHAIAARQQ